jgi:hypothetical protein
MSRDAVVHLDSIGTDLRIDVHVDLGGPRGGAVTALGAHGRLPPREQALQPGQVLGGRYELVRVLGHGSMGAVWLANHMTLGERVALKVMAPSSDPDGIESAPTAEARFRFEAQIAARLSRKTRHVVQVTDHGHDGPIAFLVMEFLQGQTLEAAILRRAPMATDEVAGLVRQIAQGLEVAHTEGVLHRDLKPANVFLVDTPEGVPFVKLLDFGLARGDDAQRSAEPFATARGVVFGTPGYMSPEQASASVEMDRRSDLWSLAAIAYEALTGELPIEGVDTNELLANVRAGRIVPLRRYRPDLADAFDRFFACAFALQASDRYATCGDLADAFERAARVSPPLAATRRLPMSAFPVASTPHRGARRLRVGAAALIALVAFVGSAYVAHTPTHAAEAAQAAALPEEDREPHETPARASTLTVTQAAAPTTPAAAALPSASSLASTETFPVSSVAKRRVSVPSGDLGEFKSHF